jgi:glutamine---fructose-6-phosphate transaminase (isomerizing)
MKFYFILQARLNLGQKFRMSQIELEIDSIPAVFRQFSVSQKEAVEAVATHLATHPVSLIATLGRGSSDHAAQFIRTISEIELGIPAVSLTPSIASVYGKQLSLKNTLAFAVSQSGRSPDLLATARMAREGGAFVVAIVNDVASPLTDIANVVLPIEAGAEIAVAATKSFAGSIAVALRLLHRISPSMMSTADFDNIADVWVTGSQDTIPGLDKILTVRSGIVIGRGTSLGIAQEAALKIKEVLQFPAEAYSAAEVMHGPLGLASSDCGIVGWITDEATAAAQQATLTQLSILGSPVLDLRSLFKPEVLNMIHPSLRPLLPLPSFYRTLAQIARQRGLDPDRPRNLLKVTETV